MTWTLCYCRNCDQPYYIGLLGDRDYCEVCRPPEEYAYLPQDYPSCSPPPSYYEPPAIKDRA